MTEQRPSSEGKTIRRTAALVLIGGAFGAGMVFRDPLMRLISPPTAIAESKDPAAKQLSPFDAAPALVSARPAVPGSRHMTGRTRAPSG